MKVKKRHINSVRLYIGIILFLYLIEDCIALFITFIFSLNNEILWIARAIILALTILFVIRHFRCHPLTLAEKKAGIRFLVGNG
jgi:membrane protein YdbS with pleckstrin-like domain